MIADPRRPAHTPPDVKHLPFSRDTPGWAVGREIKPSVETGYWGLRERRTAARPISAKPIKTIVAGSGTPETGPTF